MKKIITLLLVVALVFGLATANFSVNAEPKNFFNLKETAPIGVAGGVVAEDTADGEKVYSLSGINYKWCSMGFDVLPALKTALGNDDFIEATLAFKVKADFTDKFAGHKLSVKLIMRSLAATGVSDIDGWNSSYEDSLNGAEAVFGNYDGKNIIAYPTTKRVQISDSEWQEYTVDFYFEKSQINSGLTPDWIVCFDDMNGGHPPTSDEQENGQLIIYDKLMIKDIGLYYTEDYLAAIGTPTPEPTPVPTATPEPDTDTDTDAPAGDEGDADTVEPTAKPTAKPTAEADESKDDEQKDEEKADLTWLWIVLGAVAVAVVVIVVTKKKAAPDAEATEEKIEE
ncbi:MAG: hypothetical protein IKB86_07320 [Clostridia bacterium]|nr:hypothetical protein [Clostridia bacterium]